MPGTRKLGRKTDHRKAMLRAMVTYLLENGQIETTVTRAKEVRAVAEKMITLGKNSDLHSKRQVFAYVTKEDVAKKLFDEISPKYAERNGGYTRIIKIGPRRGDAAEMAIIQLVLYMIRPALCRFYFCKKTALMHLVGNAWGLLMSYLKIEWSGKK